LQENYLHKDFDVGIMMCVEQYKFVVVYVHLGVGFPPTLDAFSKFSNVKNDNSLRILITDNEKLGAKFDGQTIVIEGRSQASNYLLKERGYYKKLASGYWINTFERIFALRALGKLPEISSLPIIHLESDVAPLFNLEDVRFLEYNFTNVAVPRFSKLLGIGSFIFTPNVEKLISVVNSLEELAIKNIDWLENDMQLLGIALNQELILELPSHPSDYFKRKYNSVNDYKLIFDGAALGQYLFGQDPFHQSGQRYSGFKNPAYSERTNLEAIKWKLGIDNQESRLIMELDSIQFKVANLHVHSKEVLPPFSVNNARWIRAIEEANGVTDRKREHTTELSPHSKRPNIWLRLQIAKSNGFWRALFSWMTRRML
jgi:hypothetical protein